MVVEFPNRKLLLALSLFNVVLGASGDSGSSGRMFPVAAYEIPVSSGRTAFEQYGCVGSCQSLVDGTFMVTTGRRGESGALWHPIRWGGGGLTSNGTSGSGFSQVIEVDIAISGSPLYSEGFGIWLAQSASVDQLYMTDPQALSLPGPHLWSLLSFDPHFKGVGVAFATRDRNNGAKPSISLLPGHGSREGIDPRRSVPSRFGVYYEWTATSRISLKITLRSDGSLHGTFSTPESNGDVYTAFEVPKKDLPTRPTSGYLIITAGNTANNLPSNADPATKPGRDALLLRTQITRLKILTPRRDVAVHPQGSSVVQAAEALREHVAVGDVPASLELLGHILTDQLLPRQELALAALRNVTQVAASLGHLRATVESQGEEINQLRAALNLQERDEIKDGQHRLTSTVKAAHSLTLWATILLGSIFVAFAAVFYKRMSDLEKRHYL